jgi:GTP cyclohydrolase I
MNSDLKKDSTNTSDLSTTSKDGEKVEVSKANKIAVLIKEMLEIINPNACEEVMTNTPLRYAKALMEFTSGYDEVPLGDGGVFDNEGFDDLIIIKDINFNSMCEHHMLPFFGDCSIGYIPKDKILGLSKFPRLVQSISKKFQIQERLSKEIADELNKALDPVGVVVKITCSHSCMCFRGIKSFNAKTDSIFTTGCFRNDKNALDKFFNLLGK